MTSNGPLAPDQHRAMAAATFNRCWELLETAERTNDQNRELLTAAFTSRYHWSTIGGDEQLITSDWMVSRAAGAVGEARLSVAYAKLANEAAEQATVPDWLLASTAEGLARAWRTAGDVNQSREWAARAAALVQGIEDDESRGLIAGQLADLL
jgi:hypothetical protein